MSVPVKSTRSKNVVVRDFVQFLHPAPDEFSCPEIVINAVSALQRSSDFEIANVGHTITNKAVADLSPENCIWEDMPFYAFLPFVAKLYYMPAVIEQSLVLLRPSLGLDGFINSFMPPPDNRKKNRMEIYERFVAEWPPWYQNVMCELLRTILNNPTVFEYEFEFANSAWEREE